jgi:sulfur transfer complex TusBCD TusB component (DsrH family)
MSGFFGIPTLQSVTTVGGTTNQSVELQGNTLSTGYLNISGAFDVVSTGTYAADQKMLSDVFWNFGDSQEVRIGLNGSQFVIDPITSGSGAKMFFGDGATGVKVTMGDCVAAAINGTTATLTTPTLETTVFALTSVATNDDPIILWQQGRVATTNATVTTLQTITTSSNTCIMIDAKVVARRTGGTAGTAVDVAAYKRIAAFKNVSGVLTQIGTTTDAGTFESQAGWDCTIDISGTSIRIRATGAANNNVTWHSTTQISRVST